MKIHIYDLTGSATCAEFETSAEYSRPQETKRYVINKVLIIPEAQTNRTPYLQNSESPILQDLANERGEYSNRTAFHWQQSFRDLAEGGNPEIIAAFFAALSQEDYFGCAERNIILIPDNFSPQTQEHILRHCKMPRKNTFLLWRSVSAAIGYSKELPIKGEITVIDFQAYETQVSRLSILEYEGKAIPQRRAYKDGSIAYPYHLNTGIRELYFNELGKISDFYNYTFFGKEGDFVIWNEIQRQFEIQHFQRKRLRPRIDFHYAGENLCIQIGSSTPYTENTDNLRMDKGSRRMFYGAAKFAVFIHSKKILYFDQCDGLYIVVGNRREQKYHAKQLIPFNKYSPGGKPIVGEINDDCYLEANTPAANFYLLTGEKDNLNSTPLKQYIHEFDVGREHAKAKLKLHPSIIPGQGIAQVRVESDIIQGDVHLDLLKMSSTDKTINKLQKEMPLRWPIAIPGVVARTELWQKYEVQLKVKDYVKRNYADGSLFAQSLWPNRNKEGEERFERWNVFGSREQYERPIDPTFDFDAFFAKLSLDYATCREIRRKNNLLGMISWTYCRSDEFFQDVKRDCFRFLHGYYTELDSRRIFTACANLFYKDEELTLFFNSFSDFIRNCIMSENTTGVASWTRVLSELLINHPHMLSLISDNLCGNTVKNLGKLLKLVRNEPNKRRFSLKCILYMLTRRKYNYDFYSSSREIDSMKYALSYVSPTDQMRISVEKFLEGTATIDDIPFD